MTRAYDHSEVYGSEEEISLSDKTVYEIMLHHKEDEKEPSCDNPNYICDITPIMDGLNSEGLYSADSLRELKNNRAILKEGVYKVYMFPDWGELNDMLETCAISGRKKLILLITLSEKYLYRRFVADELQTDITKEFSEMSDIVEEKCRILQLKGFRVSGNDVPYGFTVEINW